MKKTTVVCRNFFDPKSPCEAKIVLIADDYEDHFDRLKRLGWGRLWEPLPLCPKCRAKKTLESV